MKYDNPTSTSYESHDTIKEHRCTLIFNIVMRFIATALEKEFTVRFTFHEDDVTLWTENEDFESTERAGEELQKELFIIEKTLAYTGRHHQ